MSVIEKKRALRNEIAQKKRKVSSDNHRSESEEIVKLIEASEVFQSANTMLAYWSMDDEVDVRPLLNRWSDKKKILLPCVADDHLELRFFEGEDVLTPKGKYRIMEPYGDLFTDYDQIDLVIIPGIAFDWAGYRLGRGGGYYDKLLPLLNRAYKMGVGFSFQLVSNVPVEIHDQRLDCTIIPQ